VRRILDDLPCGLEAVHAGQSAIHYHNLRMQFFRQLDGILSVARFTNHFHIGFIFEHAAETAPHQTVIIHQQYCDLLYHKILLSPWERTDAPGFHLLVGVKK
jgi:hypothetical protein